MAKSVFQNIILNFQFKIEPSDPLDISEHSKPITVQEPAPTKSKSGKNTVPRETSLDEQKKISNCKLCQSSKTCQRTLCAKCLDSYLSMIDEEYCCKLCDQKNTQKEIVIHHLDKDHFAKLFVNSTKTSEISDPKNVESLPEVNDTKENANQITVSQFFFFREIIFTKNFVKLISR